MLLLLISLFGGLLWHISNRQYPANDSAEYMEKTQGFYKTLLEEGTLEALKQSYLDRNWRGVALAPTLLPFLILTQGDARLAQSLWCLTLLLLIAYHVFRFLKKSLDPKNAALGTSLIVSLPWLQQASHDFNSELPMIAAIAACVYYGRQNLNLKSLPDAVGFGLWLGFGTLIRPAEMLLVFLVPLLIWTAVNFKTKKLQPLDLLAPAVLTIFLVSFLSRPYHNPTLEPLLALALTVFFLFGIVVWELNRVFHVMFMSFYIPTAIWYFGDRFRIFPYLFSSSFSSNTEADPQALISRQIAKSAPRFFLEIFHWVAGYPFLLLCLVGFLAAWTYRKDLKNKVDQNSYLILSLAYMIFLPPLAGAFSYNWDYRYYVDIGITLWMLGALIVLQPLPKFKNWGILFTTLILFLFGFVNYSSSRTPLRNWTPPILLKIFPDYFVRSPLWPYKEPKASEVGTWPSLLEELKLSLSDPNEIKIVLSNCGDGHSLQVMAFEKKVYWPFNPEGSPQFTDRVDKARDYLNKEKGTLILFCNQQNSVEGSLGQLLKDQNDSEIQASLNVIPVMKSKLTGAMAYLSK